MNARRAEVWAALAGTACAVVSACGDVPTTRPGGIVDGEVDLGHPSVAALLDDQLRPMCTGSLVTPTVVLTAAHCLVAWQSGRVALPAHAFFGTEVTGEGVTVEIAWGEVYPGYNETRFAGDVALLGLTEAVALPPLPLIDRQLTAAVVGVPVRIVGFGFPNTGPSGTPGNKLFRDMVIESLSPEAFEYGEITCNGDSGGPAFLTDGSDEMVAGVTSNGPRGCHGWGSSARVDAYLPWIRSRMHLVGSLCEIDGRCTRDCGQPDPDCECPPDGRCADCSDRTDVDCELARVGEPCASAGCESGAACYDGRCLETCVPGQQNCPDSLQCAGDAGSVNSVCVGDSTEAPPPSGCSWAGDPRDGVAVTWLVWLMLAVWVGSRKRGAPRCVALASWAVVAAALLAACESAELARGDERPVDEPFPPDAPMLDWFEDVTESSGVASVDMMDVRGVAIADLDGDGLLDIVAPRGYYGVVALRNAGAFRFDDVTTDSGLVLPLQFHAIAVAAGDLDNDGFVDLVVSGNQGIVAFRNEGGGAFLLRGRDAGFALETDRDYALLVSDLDGDGAIDIYAAHMTTPQRPFPDRLYRNLGDFTFADVPSRYGLDSAGETRAAPLTFDFDRDGDLDVYFANDTRVIDSGERPLPREAYPHQIPEPDRLFRNDGPDTGGGARFTDVSVEAGVDVPRSSMGVAIGDFSGDGIPDLFVSDFGQNDVLLGLGDGTFTDGSEAGPVFARRLDSQCNASDLAVSSLCWLVSWGATYEDFDLDGVQDLIVANSMVPALAGSMFGARQPMESWRGLGDGRFAPVQAGLSWRVGRGLAPADLDNDGDLDLVVAGTDSLYLFRNRVTAGNWLRVMLAGHRSNAMGLGAEVRAVLTSGRTLTRYIGAGGVEKSWAAPEAHFGLGAERVAHLEIVWPTGNVQVVRDIPVGQRIVIHEEEEGSPAP
jgi:V8-like Glu-specific endopeptidase